MERVMTQQEYVDAWAQNARQHYNDGDYKWICEKITPFKNILEFGCGAGYSTMALADGKHRILAIDLNSDALKSTQKLLEQHGYKSEIATQSIDFSESEIWLWLIDAVKDREGVASVASQIPVDAILLCNPGGNLDPNLYKYEAGLLLKYGFTEDEISQRHQQGAIPLLHKFAMIYAAADIAIRSYKPLLIVERGVGNQVKETLDLIESDTQMRKVFENFRVIRSEPENGVSLGDADGINEGELLWGAGMYIPGE